MKINRLDKNPISFTRQVVPVPDPKPTVLTDWVNSQNDSQPIKFLKNNEGQKLNILG